MNRKQYKKQAVKFLNEILPSDPEKPSISDKQKALFMQCPKYLYKYCSINDYSIANIENQQFYLCALSNLDDQFEARLSIREDFDQYFYDVIDLMRKKSDRAEKIKEFTEEELRDIYNGWNAKKIAMKHKLLSQLPEIVNKINNDGIFEQIITRFLEYLIGLREQYGVCSLSENNDSQIMWQMYANNYSGCCIEYDFGNCDDNMLKMNLLPVTYVDERKQDPMKNLLEMFIQKMDNKSDKTILANSYKWIVELLTTKNEEWKLQKEWRVINKAGTCIKAPEITSIYMGNRMSEENKQKIYEIAKRKSIDLYEITEDYEHLKIAFKKLNT